MAMFYLAPKAARGCLIRKGGRVRIVGMPDLSGVRSPSAGEASQLCFNTSRGSVRRFEASAGMAFVEISFKIRCRRLAGWHYIDIEPTPQLHR